MQLQREIAAEAVRIDARRERGGRDHLALPRGHRVHRARVATCAGASSRRRRPQPGAQPLATRMLRLVPCRAPSLAVRATDLEIVGRRIVVAAEEGAHRHRQIAHHAVAETPTKTSVRLRRQRRAAVGAIGAMKQSLGVYTRVAASQLPPDGCRSKVQRARGGISRSEITTDRSAHTNKTKEKISDSPRDFGMRGATKAAVLAVCTHARTHMPSPLADASDLGDAVVR